MKFIILVLLLAPSLLAQDFRFITSDMKDSLPLATVGREYFAPVRVQGGNPPYFFFVDPSKPLPSGMEISIDGVIFGTPEESQNTQFYINVQDSSTPRRRMLVRSLSINFSDTIMSQEASCSLSSGSWHNLLVLFFGVMILAVKRWKTI